MSKRLQILQVRSLENMVMILSPFNVLKVFSFVGWVYPMSFFFKLSIPMICYFFVECALGLLLVGWVCLRSSFTLFKVLFYSLIVLEVSFFIQVCPRYVISLLSMPEVLFYCVECAQCLLSLCWVCPRSSPPNLLQQFFFPLSVPKASFFHEMSIWWASVVHVFFPEQVLLYKEKNVGDYY